MMSASDLLIAKTAVEATNKLDTVQVGDVWVLLCFYDKITASYNSYFMPELKKGPLLARKYLSIGIVMENLGEKVSECLHFAHVIMGCDTTSRLFGIGRYIGLTLLKNNAIVCQHAVVLQNRNSTPAEMVTTGEKTGLSIQGQINRYSRFAAIFKISANVSHLQSFCSPQGTLSQHPCLL